MEVVNALMLNWLNMGQILGIGVYQNGAYATSLMQYPGWNGRDTQDFLQVLPAEIVPLYGTPEGTKYLIENGCNFNNYRMRYTSEKDEIVYGNNVRVIVLAGKNDWNVRNQPAGGYVYVTENRDQIVIAYGPGQDPIQARKLSDQILAKLVDLGY